MEKKLVNFFDSLLTKLGDQIAGSALDNVKSIKDFELTLKSLQTNLNRLSAKASDVKEEIENAEASGQKKRKREVEEWLKEVELIEKEVVELEREVESTEFISRLMRGGKAKQLNNQVDKLVEQSRNFSELLLDVRGGVRLLTTRMVGEAFTENMENILRHLKSGNVSSIGVHGMGGAGKTTLAKHIYNRLREESQVGVFLVTVSQDFTIKSLQDKIASFLGVKFLDEDEEGTRAGRLHEALSRRKNSVLIFDDVWENIDLLKVGCPFSVECCRMIITTRSLDVCRQIGCEEVIAVKKLNEDEAWKLFSETITLGKEFKLCRQVEKIAKSVVKLCNGLPLGIIVLGGGMRGETSIHTWKNALAKLQESVVGQDGMGKVEIFKVLKYSFDRLNINHQSDAFNEFQLQLCFMYCSLYPEDSEIPRVKLVQNFISDGLVDQRSRGAQVCQGYVILDKLVNVSLLESCVDSIGVECVKMHDLVRGMALQIGGGKYMVRAGDESLKEIPKEEEWTEDLEKVSLMKNGIRRIGEGTSPNCPKLSTLLLGGNLLNIIPDSFFTKMQGLCTLDLSGCSFIKMLPNSISELKSLKALLLEGCAWLEYVPYLGNLKALRELNLDRTAIKEVPRGVEELLNLKFLSIYAKKLEVVRRGLLLKLVHLQCVRLPNHLQVAIKEVKNLKELEEFWGRVNNVRDFNCFIKSRVHDHTIYTIQVGSFSEEKRYGFGDFNKKEVNKEMILTECSINDEKVLGRDIECLTINQCEGLSNCFLDDFSPSNYPTSLKKLKIARCGGIECIVRSTQELAYQFSSLEDLHLKELEDFEGVLIGQGGMELEGVFSSLRRLRIHKCDKMRKLGLRASGFPNLEEIRIENCDKIEEIFEDEGRAASLTLPKLKELWLQNLPTLKSVCKAAILAFPNLELIFIMNCSEMEGIFEDEGRAASLTLPKLRQLNLFWLPRLKRVCKATILAFPNLEEIKIESCVEMEGIFEDEGRAASPTLPKLKELSLIGLPRLKRVCKATILAFPNLEEISIEYCDEMEGIFEDEGRAASLTIPKLRRLWLMHLPRLKRLCKATILAFPNLEVISIEYCDEMEGIFEDEGRAASLTLPKLRQLRLKNLPRLKRVCKATILAFPNLKQIAIASCDEMEGIFEDEGRAASLTLPKLQWLWLEKLPRLKRVCKATILAFPNLEEIEIENCVEMEWIFEDEGRAASLTLPKLKQLTLIWLPRLKRVCKATMICNSIEEFTIISCPTLMKKLPLHLDVAPPPTLRYMSVSREWWESLEWDNPNLPTLLQPFLQFH